MNFWLETYPHKIYASVLLLDGKIIDWKIGQHYWEDPFQVKLRGNIKIEDIQRCVTKYTFWEVNNSEEHQKVFESIAKKWIELQGKSE